MIPSGRNPSLRGVQSSGSNCENIDWDVNAGGIVLSLNSVDRLFRQEFGSIIRISRSPFLTLRFRQSFPNIPKQ